MVYLRGLLTLIQLLWALFPYVVELVKWIAAQKERAERKKLVSDLISAHKEAARTGDTSKFENILSGKRSATDPGTPQS